MTEETKPPDALLLSDPHNVPVVYCNQLVGSGHLNFVINLTLAVARFTPTTAASVDTDMVIAARLRFDFYCARQIHEALGRLLSQAQPNEKPN